jgi:hypothetical protein
MDKVRNPSNSVCYTPSSEPYRIYLFIVYEVVVISDYIAFDGSWSVNDELDGMWEVEVVA